MIGRILTAWTRVKVYLAAGLAAAAILYGLFKKVVNDAVKKDRLARQVDDLKEKDAANQRMNKADVGTGDPEDDKDWLEKRGRRK